MWRLLRLAYRRGCPAQTLFAIFITNSSRRVAILNQHAGDGLCCLWDYHVIAMRYVPEERTSAVQREDNRGGGEGGGGVGYSQDDGGYCCNRNGQIALVYDVDSTLQPFPTALANYVHGSFDESITAQYVFRVVAFDDLMNNFASDRRHMKTPVDDTHQTPHHFRFISPPPRYSCIRARQLPHKHTLPFFLYVPGLPDEDLLSCTDNEPIPFVSVGTVLYGVRQLLEYFNVSGAVEPHYIQSSH